MKLFLHLKTEHEPIEAISLALKSTWKEKKGLFNSLINNTYQISAIFYQNALMF